MEFKVSRPITKSSAMFSVMVGLWIACLLYFNPRLLALLIGPESFIAKFCLLVFILGLNLFWFYVFFHLVTVGFSYFSRPGKLTSLISANPPTISPKVALLYTTCNDFQEEAVYSHLNQDYLNYHLFILDDSDTGDYQKRIDKFAKKYPHKITVIHRGNRVGFKAGNVNCALRKIDCDYEYFSISDADTILPPNYIKALLPYILNPNVAFAQANQKSNPKQQTPFAQFMGLNTDIHFRRYASTKNRFGFVMWYGHGALMRRDIWEQIGGFPEVVTEDLAYSMKVREAGYQGVFVENVICGEDFPPTYRQYRKRNEKWIRGTTECLLKFYPSFIKVAHIPWFEKLDVLVSGGSLLLALPFVLFLFLIGVALPLFFVHFQFQGSMIRMPILYDKTSWGVATQIQSNLFWSWDIFLLMIATVFAPLVAAIVDYFWQPKQMFKYLAAYIFCFFSLQVTSAIHLLIFLFTRKAVFPVTGEHHRVEYAKIKPSLPKDWFSQSHANHRAVLLMEVIVGVIFWMIGVTTQNIWFLPIAVALCMSPCLFQWNLNPKLMRYVVFVPFLMTFGIIYLIGKRLPGL